MEVIGGAVEVDGGNWRGGGGVWSEVLGGVTRVLIMVTLQCLY